MLVNLQGLLGRVPGFIVDAIPEKLFAVKFES